MTTPEASLLGKPVQYGAEYDPTLLFPIPRAQARAALGLGEDLPFVGVDFWNAYELSWLDGRGKPRVALAELRVPAASPNLVESKSLKLYLGSYAMARFTDTDALRAQLVADLSAAAGAPVSVVLTPAGSSNVALIENLEGDVIDDLPIEISHYGPPRPEFLSSDPGLKADEVLVSHLLKSNCPVTGQPDWASVQVRYAGPRIARDGLLRYLVSFRQHSDFHESCVERIFMDILGQCAPTRLAVYARYTRRGGLDINPFRATPGLPLPGNPRTNRQ
ncbi:MAG: NADPH-dependent 7-cyano-7-deazaguanine reductase QueF [Arenimonas sp. SCN 70-307]|uniref:NADPH-dependent 7-cyano-7-deazaguanine reductase QueF n=1 Tax=Arenimonas sp. SCN 70-307 TaxID=1660089 RepID=UPI0008690F5F|nr:NADPH-dependent 7-cyano-7-deazaguanine reductase QueF [Arenimonas sp. SCN 70-307]ODS62573.1 MAG: NADPH-dependent 7-cyano-7-deazaguanine reductase QueF [Arenimonas sp. SCN 70-307]